MSDSCTACQVLVVDDDAAISIVLSEFLEEEGYSVAVANNGYEALKQLRSGLRPCIILLDWMMPVMNGAEFRSVQQQDAALAEIPVAVISAHVPYDGVQQLDADVFLPKPLNFLQLVETVSQYCTG